MVHAEDPPGEPASGVDPLRASNRPRLSSAGVHASGSSPERECRIDKQEFHTVCRTREDGEDGITGEAVMIRPPTGSHVPARSATREAGREFRRS